MSVNPQFVHSSAHQAMNFNKDKGQFQEYNFAMMSKEKQDRENAEKRKNLKNFKSQEEFEREQAVYEVKKEQLRAAFAEIDADGNGTIEPDEIVMYFVKKGMDREAAN